MNARKIIKLALCLAFFAFRVAGHLSENDTSGQEMAYSNGYTAGYEEGYREGYQDGLAAWPGSNQPEEPSEPFPEPEEPGEPSQKPEDDSGFVMISDVVPDAILEIRYYSTYNFMGDRIDGYEAPTALLTQEAASALKEVSDELLEQGYRLKVYDAYRPQTAVEHFQRWAADLEDFRMKEYFYPGLDKSELFSQGYISAQSGHSRGSTVDLTLFDMASGKELDMGSPFDFFGTCSHADYTASLTVEQIDNRKLLRDTMLAHGFRGINTEWWHFTLVEEPYPDTYFDFPVTELAGLERTGNP